MKYLCLIALAALTSCTASRRLPQPTEVIRYSAYKCDCYHPDGFGIDQHYTRCGTDSVRVRTSDITKRRHDAIKVVRGNCTFIYLLTK